MMKGGTILEKEIIIEPQHKYVKDDKKICIALMASYVILTIQYFVLIYFNLIGSSSGATIQLMSKGFVGLAFLYALPTVLKRSSVKFIEVYFVAVFIFLLHFSIFPENREYMSNLIFPVFFMSLPAFIFSLSIRDFSILKEIMKKASFIVFIVGTILGGLIFSGRASAGSYSMSLSYYMLLPAIIFIDELFDKFSLKLLLATITSLLVILALGSRGAILCIIVFIFLKVIKLGIILSYKSAVLYSSLFGLAVAGYLLVDKIIESLYSFLLSYGIRSRSLSLFLSDEVYLSGRDKLYDLVIDKIVNNPILGVGIAGDRNALEGAYAHNFFVEIIGDFGIIIGLVLSVAFLIFMVKALATKNQTKYNIIIIWVSLGFVHLMVSGTYLEDIKFWILMGLLINFNRTSRINVQKSEHWHENFEKEGNL